ncbi:MAG TPA: glycogen debranching protein GlgX [Phnomibacter sp.]|nr:glycogen debranching protein GlgX [Phnomibacter sp.]
MSQHKKAPVKFAVLPGKAAPQGATMLDDAVNFSLFSKNATAVDLVFFDAADDIEPAAVFSLQPPVHKTYHYWHIAIRSVKVGQLYAWRVSGPNEPQNGHRFDQDKFLLDPYSKAIITPKAYQRKAFCREGKVSLPCLKSAVIDLGKFDWEGDGLLRRPFAKTIIYEMHVAGFTRHPNSGLSDERRGTYAGLIEKIPYLVELGITAIELLPVFQFDAQDAPEGKENYWGYSPISFFAPHMAYASASDPMEAINEFREMVKACHKAGIEVILDVVFNHTSEGNEDGPCYCFRGIDNSMYYILEKDKRNYANFTGTGNTLNANHPIVRRMIVESLHYWVEEMHIDGFRFDLASILARDEKGHPLENPPVLWDIESDPHLAGVKLIAEAWDAAGLYQVGNFIGDSWKEWNGRFRDDVRSALKGDSGKLSGLASRLLGSPDIYGHEEREPEQSINFVACHDGFTLNDVVCYNQKHNEANGEDNRDGSNDNLSWNCGVEGPTDDPGIEALRSRQVKNFLTLTLMAIGTPMILMGDEVRRTQLGNNNAYCQDNELSWFDWSLLQKHADLFAFVKKLIRVRLQRDTSNMLRSLSLNELLGSADIQWHGIKLNQPDWSHASRSIAFTIYSMQRKVVMHFMINAWQEDLLFELPPPAAYGGQWLRWLDTSLSHPDDLMEWSNAVVVDEAAYQVRSWSMAAMLCIVKEKK